MSKRSREELRMINVARRDMPRTLALLETYPQGAERERAFKLVVAAAEEAVAHVSALHEKSAQRFAVALNVFEDPIKRYLSPDK